jgi:O-antigen ligase
VTRINSAIIAVYLLLCLMLGGSAQGAWTYLGLQVAGVALIVWAAMAGSQQEREDNDSTPLHLLLLCLLVLVLLQLIPLPSDLWTGLPGRSLIAQGFGALGYPLPALPVSETPDDSVITLFAIIPAVAALIATERLRPSPRWIAAGVITGTIMAILLGALQVAGGADSPAHFYRITNSGAVGFFANRNHMATLLLIAIPLTAALLASMKSSRGLSTVARYSVATAVLVLILVGIGLNRSLAAVALAGPVLLASVPILPAGQRWRRLALPVSAIALLGAVAFVASSPIAIEYSGEQASRSAPGRTEMWGTTAKAVEATFPVGTGLGSFQQVYHQFEDLALATPIYVNHAHNDYLELVLELGAPGLLLILLFLAWWGVTAIRVWRSPLSTPFGRAATIVTGVILVHSAVDYPLRTAAIAAIFGAAIALMANRLPSSDAGELNEKRQAKHVRLG